VKVKDALPEKMKKIRNEVVQEETGKRLVSEVMLDEQPLDCYHLCVLIVIYFNPP
jgi:hypothetical protein